MALGAYRSDTPNIVLAQKWGVGNNCRLSLGRNALSVRINFLARSLNFLILTPQRMSVEA